jgi:hypothetical protein
MTETNGSADPVDANESPDPSSSPAKTPQKRTARGPAVWTATVPVESRAVDRLETTPFRPIRMRNGEAEIRTPDGQALALVRIGREEDGRRMLLVPAARQARRSEQGVVESVYSYLRLGLQRLPEYETADQPAELFRLLKNAYIHISGADIGQPRPQLSEMRGPAVRGGLPGLGKRRP